MKKAFLFDLDGCLLDSLQKHDESLYLACSEYGITIDEKIKNELFDKSSKAKLEILYKRKILDNLSIPWILERKNEIALNLCFDGFKPSMKHIDVMKYINKELNCRIVICSNSPRNFVNKYIDLCGFENLISFSLSGNDVELRKPYPDIYIKAMRLLNVHPNNVIIFEDSEEGRIAAIRSGCHDIVEIYSPEDVSPNLITELIIKYNIGYYNSKYIVYK